MKINKYVSTLSMSLFLSACGSDKGGNCNETSSCLPDPEISESQLSGNAFIDVLPDNEYVIISLFPDKTSTMMGNDNSSKTVGQENGTWYLSGNKLVFDSPELNTFDILQMENNTLTVLHENRGVEIIFKQTYKPTVSQLNKDFVSDNCSECIMKFEDNFSGVGGEGDELLPFTWSYLQDSSVFVDFGQSVGSIRYFFTAVSGSGLDYVALFDFSDEPEPYLREATLIEGGGS